MSAVDHSPVRCWVVCERGNRWTTAVQRFLAEIVPTTPSGSSSNVHTISCVPPKDVSTMLAGPPCSVVLWEVDPANFLSVCDSITLATIAMPQALQLAAVTGLSRGEMIVLSELGVATTVRRTEQLPSLKRMIQGHFARAA